MVMKSITVLDEGSSTGSFMRVFMIGSSNSSGASSYKFYQARSKTD